MLSIHRKDAETQRLISFYLGDDCLIEIRFTIVYVIEDCNRGMWLLCRKNVQLFPFVLAVAYILNETDVMNSQLGLIVERTIQTTIIKIDFHGYKSSNIFRNLSREKNTALKPPPGKG